jgi:uncharacterized protein
VLLRMGFLLGEPRWLAAAERTLQAAWPSLEKFPHAHGSMLDALEDHLRPPQAVVLRGAADGVERWRAELDRLYAPQRILLAIPDDARSLPPGLADKRPGAAPGGVVAYLCEGSQCTALIDDLAELVRHLRLRLDAPLEEPR